MKHKVTDADLARIADSEALDSKFFDYETAFSRNIGWVTQSEQQSLRGKRVAIAGLGGVGGLHLLTLARLGIGAFSVAEFDRYEIANFNRQVGATMASLGRPKLDVMVEMAKDINPDLQISAFDQGIEEANIDAFLEGADLFVDGFDFFVLDIRAKVFARARELGIPAITAGPIGFGAAYLLFTPDGMSFEDYFRLEGLSQEEQYINFLIGLTPKAPHRHYLVDPSRLDLAAKKGPSAGAACQLCAGVVGIEAVKILLGRGPLRPAPAYQAFDAYRGEWIRGRLWGGNAHPLQRLKHRMIEKKMRGAVLKAVARSVPEDAPEIEKILDLARWAPSGDNSQPWRFEVKGEDAVTLHIQDQSDWDLYDYDGGRPSLLSTGALLETLRIAASDFGKMIWWDYRSPDRGQTGPRRHLIDVTLQPAPGTPADPLLPTVTERSVDRRPYGLAPLTAGQKEALEAAVAPDFTLEWFESRQARWRFAKMNGQASDIRLRLRQAYEVHRKMIDWDRSLSPGGIPAGAIGLDAGTLKIMRWAMADWSRLDRLNRVLGTLSARLQLDYLPGLFCAAHFALKAKAPLKSPQDLLKAGGALQRFWLAATDLGLALQPGMAAMIFAHHGENTPDLFADERQRAQARGLARELADLVGRNENEELVFLGRLGKAKRAGVPSRSIRRPLEELLLPAATEGAERDLEQAATMARRVGE